MFVNILYTWILWDMNCPYLVMMKCPQPISYIYFCVHHQIYLYVENQLISHTA